VIPENYKSTEVFRSTAVPDGDRYTSIIRRWQPKADDNDDDEINCPAVDLDDEPQAK
jgi:hypothetical protein